MRPQVVTLISPGTSNWIPVDFYKLPFMISMAVTVTGSATASVEYTLDDVWDPAVTPVAYQVTGMNAITSNTHGVVDFPVRAVRLTAGPVSGSATLTILQGRSS